MSSYSFDARQRFVIDDYSSLSPFASFLPGIAGPLGIPLWAFYVNRGQAIASFGLESKDQPVMEFQPANKAYQLTPLTGFRTFIKIQQGAAIKSYEPFSATDRSGARRQQMHIAANELELQEVDVEAGLQVNVVYFIVPNESFAALARQVTITNIASQSIAGEVLDGLPIVIPYGVNNTQLKEINRTVEAWMDVFNREHNVPFYRVRSSIIDTAEVESVEAGHFYLAYVQNDRPQPLPAIVDATLVFGQNTSLSYPDHFRRHSLSDLLQQRQNTAGKTPCGFFGTSLALAPGQSLTLSVIIGHMSSVELVNAECARLMQADYVPNKRREANALSEALTEVVATRTSSTRFDAYCRQTLLDNVMRGGWPVLLGSESRSHVYHIYSRKHGDLERDYNAFFQAAEFYSQGNGNYRDVNQNRRSDVLLNPCVEDADVIAFMNLIQADGYNPLVIEGSRFFVAPADRAALLDRVEQPAGLSRFFERAFAPGQLLKWINDQQLRLKVSREEFLSHVMSCARPRFEATHGEGYWIDHWTYNLDLIESFLAVYPDRKEQLLFRSPIFTFYDNAVCVRPRAEKYVLAKDGVRQYGSVATDPEKAALIAARAELPQCMRMAGDQSDVYRTPLFAKLVSLVLNKFATLDPLGMGIEMEAEKPGWYDALNGLPALLGSSMPETFELYRLLTFMREAAREVGDRAIRLPVEVHDFLRQVLRHLEAYTASAEPDRDYVYWDTVAGERETYRARIRLAFDGQEIAIDLNEMDRDLAAMQRKVQAGIDRALDMNGGLPPTYFTWTVEEYELLRDASGQPRLDAKDRPFVKARRFKPTLLPLFLEGPARYLKIVTDPAVAQRVYRQVRASGLFDQKLQMYKVNASLKDQPLEIGRARAFTPGWLENESIWLHMEFKYLLEVLRTGLLPEFFADMRAALPPFLDPAVYGRSPLENSSFIVSSAHPDESLHGRGFVARLSGSTAEFLSMWQEMMAGRQPFFMQDNQLCLKLQPTLPGWLFDDDGLVTFNFLGHCTVIYHNRERRSTFGDDGVEPRKIVLKADDGSPVELTGSIIGAPHAARVRAGLIKTINVVLGNKTNHG
jgi:hypothetical protein